MGEILQTLMRDADINSDGPMEHWARWHMEPNQTDGGRSLRCTITGRKKWAGEFQTGESVEVVSVKDLQGIFKVRHQIVSIFDAHGDPDHAGGDAHFPAGLVGHAHVGRGDGMAERGVQAA